MDDRIEPEGPSWASFQNYTTDPIRPEPAGPAQAPDEPRDVNDPWRQPPRVRQHGAREAPPVLPARTPSRLSLPIAGAMICVAAVVGFLLARPPLRAPAPQLTAAATSAAPSLQIQVAPTPSPNAVGPAPAGPAAVVASPGQGAEVLPPPPPLPPLAPRAAAGTARRDPVQPALPGESVRVFVHIADAGQRPAADRLRAELNGLRFGDHPVETPPVRLVAGSPRRNEVRCLKHADCAAAGRVARYLAQSLGGPVSVVDMSPQYEGDPRVRAGSLELWLRP